MAKTPPQKPAKDGLVSTGFRLPPDLLEATRVAAARNGHSLNAEVIARLLDVPLREQLAQQGRDIAELKRMVKELLEK